MSKGREECFNICSELTAEVSAILDTCTFVQRHGEELEAGRMELAMTGKAFTELNRSELMVQLLFYTRIFARFSPEQKAGPPACPCL